VVPVTEDTEIITLQDEDGNEVDFEVIDSIEVDYTQYVLLAPVDPEEGEENAAYLFRVDEDENGDQTLVPVEDDEEFERVEAALQERDEAYADDEEYEDEDFDPFEEDEEDS